RLTARDRDAGVVVVPGREPPVEPGAARRIERGGRVAGEIGREIEGRPEVHAAAQAPRHVAPTARDAVATDAAISAARTPSAGRARHERGRDARAVVDALDAP